MKLSIEIDELLTCATDIQAKAGDQVVIYQGAVLCVYKAPLMLENVERKETVRRFMSGEKLTLVKATLSVHDLTDSHRYGILTVIVIHPDCSLRTLRRHSSMRFPEGCKAWMMSMRHEGLLTVKPSSHLTKRGTCYLITEKGRQFIKEYEDIRP